MLTVRKMSQLRTTTPGGGAALNVNHVTVVGVLVGPMRVVTRSIVTFSVATERCGHTYIHQVVARGAEARACIRQSRFFQPGGEVSVSGGLHHQVLPGADGSPDRQVVVVARVVEPRALVEVEARGGGTPVSDTAFARSAVGGSCQVFLLGVLQDVPTEVVTPAGKTVTKFRLATAGSSGICLHDVSVYGVGPAAFCARNLTVGRQASVSGWARPISLPGASGPCRRVDVVADAVQPRRLPVVVPGEPLV